MLHPARTLPSGEVRAAAGFSENVAIGSFSRGLNDAVSEAAANPGGPPATDATFAKGALVAASVAPGLSPFGAARVGLGAQFEAGLAYTGRALRADVRRSFDLSPGVSIGVGVGGSAALYGQQGARPLPNVDLSTMFGWGADVPVLVGYESAGGLYMAWAGARAGWEHVDIGPLPTEPGNPTIGAAPASLSATRLWGGGVAGLAVGFRHLHAAAELDVSYARITGEYNQVQASIDGLTVAPSAALWWNF